jgi:septum formation protein
MTEYILASKSPRRKSLLRNLIDGFIVINPDIEEARLEQELPENYVLRISEEKARAASEFVNPSGGDDWVVIAADTIVVDGDRILGKPTTEEQAAQMLVDLRGKAHTVYSGLAVYQVSQDEIRSRIVSSEVVMREYTDKEVTAYVASGDPMDKAGAYAIQNHQFDPAPAFSHCYANVMGLPLCHLAVLLNEIDRPGLADVADRCQESIQYQCPIFSQILLDRNGKE